MVGSRKFCYVETRTSYRGIDIYHPIFWGYSTILVRHLSVYGDHCSAFETLKILEVKIVVVAAFKSFSPML